MSENIKAHPNSLLGKSLGGQAKFFSASDAVMYINKIKLPTAVSFSWDMSESRIPLFGYNDRLFRSVTRGRLQIAGSFEVNYLYKGFVEILMMGNEKQRIAGLIEVVQNEPFIAAALKTRVENGKLQPMDQMKESDIISLIQASVSDPTLSNEDKLSRVTKINSFLEGKFYTESPKSVRAAQIIQDPFRIDIFYSNHNKIDPSLGSGQLGRINILSESFLDCYTIGKSKTVRAEVGGPDGGGSPVLETFQFIARETE